MCFLGRHPHIYGLATSVKGIYLLLTVAGQGKSVCIISFIYFMQMKDTSLRDVFGVPLYTYICNSVSYLTNQTRTIQKSLRVCLSKNKYPPSSYSILTVHEQPLTLLMSYMRKDVLATFFSRYLLLKKWRALKRSTTSIQNTYILNTLFLQ